MLYLCRAYNIIILCFCDILYHVRNSGIWVEILGNLLQFSFSDFWLDLFAEMIRLTAFFNGGLRD
jgi:hypothetical protein